jgi:integrase
VTRACNFQKHWHRAVTAAGLPGLHVHDLRHAGSTLAASTGLSLRDLMERLGHSSTRAALIYQHASKDRDRAIADALDVLATEHNERAQSRPDDDDDPPLAEVPTGT